MYLQLHQINNGCYISACIANYLFYYLYIFA